MSQSGNFQKPSLSFVCSEDWNKMTPCEKGRFCGSCQKTVIDFTQKSVAEIQELLSKQKEKVCGRFYAHQLAQPVQNRFSYNSFFSAAFVFFGLNFLSKEAEAQQKQFPATKQITSKPKLKNGEEVIHSKLVVTTGIVVMDDPSPYAGVVDHPEIMPEYKTGGMVGLQKFLTNNRKTLQNGTKGLVVVSFVVDTFGTVNYVRVIKSLSDEANQEAIRLANLLEFQPGMLNGRKVKVRYTLPIRFEN